MSRIIPLIIIFTFAILLYAPAVLAASAKNDNCKTDEKGEVRCELVDPLGGKSGSVPAIVGGVIRVVLGVIGSLALLMFFWGAYHWVFSFGNEERVKKGGQTMLWAAIGVLLILSSYVLLKQVFNLLSPTP